MSERACSLKVHKLGNWQGTPEFRVCGKLCLQGSDYCPRHDALIGAVGLTRAERIEQESGASHA